MAWLKTVSIWLVIVAAIMALVNLSLSLILGPVDENGRLLIAMFRIVAWGVVAGLAIIVIFDLISWLR